MSIQKLSKMNFPFIKRVDIPWCFRNGGSGLHTPNMSSINIEAHTEQGLPEQS